MKSNRFATSLCALTIALVAHSLSAEVPAGDTPAIEAANPYLAPSALSGQALFDYVLRMQSRPESIRVRPGFAAAVDEAVERLLASQPAEPLRSQALLARFEALHFSACDGDSAADERLKALAAALADDSIAEVARDARRYALEYRALELTKEQAADCETILGEIRASLTDLKLDKRHLRLASAASHVINLIEDDAVAAKHLQEFGALFAASEDKHLAHYGRGMKKAAGEPRPEDKPAIELVGKTLELEGATVEGLDFAWQSYRGKVVLVDFWATWCGPCKAELPNVKSQYEQYHARGFEVVGISLDREREALEKFLAEQELPWTTLFDDEAEGRHPLAEKYGVHAIPTAILVDREGRVVSQSARGEELVRLLAEMLGPPEEEAENAK